MVQIASHHHPGHPLAKDAGYTPSCAWPDDCYVQWGSSGVVLGGNENYRTAFFEAFPNDNSGGFIRGEGASIEDAECKAFTRWRQESQCQHIWSRQVRKKDGTPGWLYTNGGGVCVKCGAFKLVFQPLFELGSYRQPLSSEEISYITSGFLASGFGDTGSAKYRRRLEVRARYFGIQLPDKPAGDLDCFSDEREAYAEACMDAMIEYYLKSRERLRASNSEGAVSRLLNSIGLMAVEREAKRRGLIDE